MGNQSSSKNQSSAKDDVRAAFDKNELHLLQALYEDLARRNEQPEVDKATFLDFFAVPIILGERLFQVFDWKKTGVIDLDEFLGGLAKYAKGSTEQKMEMLFHVYDLNEEQAVNKDELKMMLFSLVSPQASVVDNPGALTENATYDEEEIESNVKGSLQQPLPGSPRKSSNMEAALSMSSIDGDSARSPIDMREAITRMVDEAFEECDLDHSNKLSLDQWKLFVNKHPALVENLEYVLLGSVWDFIHPENIGLGTNMADDDAYNMGLYESSTQHGLRVQMVAEDVRQLYYCDQSQTEVWVGGNPTTENEDTNVTQISIQFHGDGQFTPADIQFCPFTGKKLQYVQQQVTEKVQIESIQQSKKRKKVTFKQGTLYTKKKWNKMDPKYYVITGPFLYSFANSNVTGQQFDSVSYILGFFIEPEIRTEKGKFGIKFIPPAGSRNAPLTLWADSAETRTEWVAALRKAAKTSKIQDVYELGDSIGKGQFSTVLMAQHIDTGDLVAVKDINKSKLDAREKEAIQNEIAICQLVAHPNVIRLKEVFETQKSMYLVMPLLKGDLFSYLKKKKRLTEDIAKRITWKLLDALKYLHALGIVHRDLKPENILMKFPDVDPTEIMIADFGLSKFAMPHERLQLACGTVAYVAPEVLRLRGYDKSCDLWSVGVILYLMLRGRLPFDAAQKKDIIKMTLSRPANLADPYWRKISNPPKNLISKLLKKNPDNRINLETAMAHVWFDDVRDDLTSARQGSIRMLAPPTGPLSPSRKSDPSQLPPYDKVVNS